MAHPMEQEYSIIDAPPWPCQVMIGIRLRSVAWALRVWTRQLMLRLQPSVMRRRKELVDLLSLGNLSWFLSSTLKSKFAS